jgi:hypothetical protein
MPGSRLVHDDRINVAQRSGFGSRVPRLPSQLQQGRRRPSAGLGTFPAAQPAGEVVDEGGRRMLHRGEIDVARRLAAGALDLQPGGAAVDCLVDGRRWVDRFALAPHSLVPAFAEEPVGLLKHGLGLGPHLRRLGGQDPGHRTRLPSSLFSALWSPPESGVECLVTTGAEGARPRTCKGSGRQAEKA